MKKLRRTKLRKVMQNNVRQTTLFVTLCGLVAILYAGYRLVAILTPGVIIEQQIVNPRAPSTLVCGLEAAESLTKLKDVTPILSEAYQKRLTQTPALSSNLVINSELTQTDPETSQPVGYSYNIENATSNYFRFMGDDGQMGLRVSSTQPAGTDATMPSWIMNPVNLSSNSTYVYSFWYRSDSPADVALSITKRSQTDYHYITTLPAVPNWKQMTGHFDNTEEASNLQIIVQGTNAGDLDTRGYDIHEIPTAALSAGIISVAFDDGWQSTKDVALDLLDTYHIRTTQYIISQVAKSRVYEYMDLNVIKQLNERGHEIGSHSLTHCNQTVLDTVALEDNATRSKTILEDAGIGPVTQFAYPLGQYNAATQAVYEKYYPLIRTSDAGFNDRYFDETALKSMGILNTTSDEELRQWVNKARNDHLWLIIVYHRVDESGEYNVTHEQLARQLKIISDSHLLVIPIGETAQLIRK
jgi:peptidoglycan/xylan/chitin deacetylase (PgdA/CDA1 family)